MKNFETQVNNSDNVDNWTLQQCEDYLAKYPNGLKADKVRLRKQTLTANNSKDSDRPVLFHHMNDSRVSPENLKKRKNEKQEKLKDTMIGIIVLVVITAIMILFFSANFNIYIECIIGLLLFGIWCWILEGVVTDASDFLFG